MQAPPTQLPARLLEHTPSRPHQHHLLIHRPSPQVLLLLSSAAVKPGREVWCLSKLREHSCLFQTGHPTSSPAPPTQNLTKGTFIHRGLGNHCGVYSGCIHTHLKGKKKKDASVCSKVWKICPWQTVGQCVRFNMRINTHTNTQEYINSTGKAAQTFACWERYKKLQHHWRVYQKSGCMLLQLKLFMQIT